TAFIRDVGERVNAEALQRRSSDRLGALLESAPDAVILVDQRGTIVFANAQTERLFEYTRTELLGEPIELLLPERFRDRHVAHRNGYLGDPVTRPMGVGLTLAGRRKDGSEFPVDISLSAIQTEEGILATAFVRDITERVAATALQQHLGERRVLAAHIARALRLYLEELGEDGETQYRLDNRLRTQPGDETRVILYRIAKEALTNARKHAQAHAVNVQLQEQETGYLVRITDDGVGFVSN